jgi:hypothetical protein
MFSATASSSIALSRAKKLGVSAGARMKPGVDRSARTIVTLLAILGQAYMRVEASVPATA